MNSKNNLYDLSFQYDIIFISFQEIFLATNFHRACKKQMENGNIYYTKIFVTYLMAVNLKLHAIESFLGFQPVVFNSFVMIALSQSTSQRFSH